MGSSGNVEVECARPMGTSVQDFLTASLGGLFDKAHRLSL